MPTTYRLVYRKDNGGLGECVVPTLDPVRRAFPTNKWVRLPNDERIRAGSVRAIGRCDDDRLTGAWLVADHGLDGSPDETASPAFNWTQAWRDVVALTIGLTPDDPRWGTVNAWYDQAEAATQARDALKFLSIQHELEILLAQAPAGLASPAA